MNHEQKAIDHWQRSAEYESLANIRTLVEQADTTDSQYLRNRLWSAFTAGLKAGKQIERDRIAGKLAGLVE